jgi:hypothetical protein
VKSKTLILNPEFGPVLKEMRGAWDHQLCFGRNKQNFAEIMDHLQEGIGQCSKSIGMDHSFISCLPGAEILSQKDYESFLSDKVPFISERFFHPDSVHLGSSRHVCIGPVQIKGIGRNMLVSRVDFIHAWGGATKLEGVYSYLASNLIDQQFPLGAAATLRVDMVGQEQAHIYRKFDSYRISQYAPSMDREEKHQIRSFIEESFGTLTPALMAKKLSYNFACMAFLNGYNYSMTSENILVDGRIIDCESFYNGTDLDAFGFFVDLNLTGARCKKIDANRLRDLEYLSGLFQGQKDTMFCNSSVHGAMHILSRFQTMYEDLFEQKLPAMKQLYWSYLNELAKVMTGKALADGLIDLLKKMAERPCEVAHYTGGELFFNWRKELRPLKKFLVPGQSGRVFFVSAGEDQVFVRVRFNLKRFPFKSQLLQVFNSQRRLDLYKEAAISLESLGEDPIVNASSLNFAINRSLFALPIEFKKDGKLELKTMTKTEFLKNLRTNMTVKPELLLVRYKSLKAGVLKEAEAPVSGLPREEMVIYEIRSKETGFIYRFRPTWINHGKA